MKNIFSFLLSLMVLALFFATPLSAETLTVATGQSEGCTVIPFDGERNYGRQFVQTIYPDTMLSGIANGDTITSLEYYINTGVVAGVWDDHILEFSLANTVLNELPNSFDPTPSTMVYRGTVTVTPTGYKVTFTRPFVYTGGNLLVQIVQPYRYSSPRSDINYAGQYYRPAFSRTNIFSLDTAVSKGSVMRFIPKTTITYSKKSQTAPSCVAPTNLAVTNITSSSVTLAWSSVAADTQIVEVTELDGTTNYHSSYSTTYTVTGLDPNTSYIFNVRCATSPGVRSAYANTVKATTLCLDFSVPYTQDFENGPYEYYTPNSIERICWDGMNSGNNDYTTPLYESVQYGTPSTNHALMIKGEYSKPSLYLVMPSLGNDTGYQVTFDCEYRVGSQNTLTLGYMSNTLSESTFVPLYSVPAQPYTQMANLTNIPTGTRLAFRTLTGGSGKYEVYLDNIEVKRHYTVSSTPNNPYRGTVTGAGMYGEGDTVTLVATPALGSEFVRWSDGQTAAQRIFIATADVTIDAIFRTDTVTAADGAVTDGAVPVSGNYAAYKQVAQMLYPSSELSEISVGDTVTSLHFFVSNGSNVGKWDDQTFDVRLANTSESNLATAFDQTPTTVFYSGRLTATVAGGMTVTFTRPFVYTGGNILVQFSKYEEPSTNAAVHFYGKNISKASRYCIHTEDVSSSAGSYVLDFLPKCEFVLHDNLTDDPTQPCAAPTALTVSNITATSVDLTWNYATAASYSVEVTDQAGNRALYVSNSNTFTVNGLTPHSRYLFDVRSICAIGDTSLYANTVLVYTRCDSGTLPYTEDFDGFLDSYTGPGMIEAICWNDYGVSADRTSYPYYEGGAPDGVLTLYGSATQPFYLILPTLDAVGKYRAGFDFSYANTVYGNVDFGYMTDCSNPNSFVSAYTATTSGPHIVDFSNLPAGARFAFRVRGGCPDTKLGYIDNVRVSELVEIDAQPNDTLGGVVTGAGSYVVGETVTLTATANAGYKFNGWTNGATNTTLTFAATVDSSFVATFVMLCADPTNASAHNITDSSLVLSWTSSASSAYITVTNPSGVTTAHSVTDTSYSVTGLTPATKYIFNIRSVCAAGDTSVNAAIITATTLAQQPYSGTTDSITVYDGTSDDNFSPYAEQKYSNKRTTVNTTMRASRLTAMVGADITDMRFYLANRGSSAAMTEFYLKEVASGSDVGLLDLSTATLLHGGVINFNQDTLTIHFDTPFRYSGGDLVLATSNTTTDLTTVASVRYYGSYPRDSRSVYTDHTSVSKIIYSYFIPKTTFLFVKPCNAPSDLKVSNVTSTSAELSWTAGSSTTCVVDIDNNGTVTHQVATTNPYTVQNLASNTQYSFTVRSICGVGDTSACSNSVTLQTSECVTPVNLVASNHTETSFNLSWAGTTTTGTYQVVLAALGATPQVYTTSANSYSFTGLTAGTPYIVKVRTICGVGDTSAYSDTIVVYTLCSPMTLPYSESFESLSSFYFGPGTISSICWSDLNASSTGYPLYHGFSGSGSDGTHSLMFANNTAQDIYVILPSFGNVTDFNVTFDCGYEDLNCSGVFHLGYLTDANDTSTFVSVYDATDSVAMNWQSHASDVLNLPAGARLAFRYSAGCPSLYFGWLDNVVVNGYVDVIAQSDDSTKGTTAGSGTFFIGDNVTVTATAGLNNHFVNWSNGDSTSATSITVVHDTTLTAYFAIDEFDVTASVNATQMGIVTGSGRYAFGAIATLTANANAGHHFEHWSNGLTTPSINISVVSDTALTATFAVDPTYLIMRSESICPGDTFVWRNRALAAPGVYYDSLQTQYGSDSIYELILSYSPTYLFSDTDIVCQGDNYYWHSRVLTTGGVYYDSLRTVNGCDSVYRLALTVCQKHFTAETATICQGETYYWHSRALTSMGIYYDSLTTVAGCDSVFQLTLYVNPSYLIEEFGHVCQGQAYQWRERDYHTSGVYYDSFQTVSGCDSVFKLTLSVTQHYHFYDYQSTCQGRPVQWRGKSCMLTGSYFDSLTTVDGCDSIYELVLTTYQSFYRESHLICPNGTFVWHDSTYTAPGIYMDTVPAQTAEECDSICMLVLLQATDYVVYDTLDLCGDYIVWHNQTITQPGVYYDSLRSEDGCDSVCVLTVFAEVYTVTALSSDSTKGSVTGSGIYQCGTLACLTAKAEQNYHFTQWSNGETSATICFNVYSDTTMTAYFDVAQGVDEVGNTEIKAAAEGSTIHIRGAEGHAVMLYDAVGRVVRRIDEASELENIQVHAAGVYFVRLDSGFTVRVIVK